METLTLAIGSRGRGTGETDSDRCAD